ncbi:MAG: DUF2191 domain-containing protein [Nocardioides sp.]
MRTTLDIDDRLLAIARVRASERNISLGKAVSELIEQGLTSRPAFELSETGWPVFDSPPGHIVTDDMVRAALDEE